MPRKGENIYLRKDKRWEARYIKGRDSNGKAIYGYVYGKSYAKVKEKLQLIKSSLPVAVLPPEEPAEEMLETSFFQVSQDWLLNTKAKDSSKVKYSNLLNLYILTYYKDLSIQNITSESIDDFCETLMVKGGQLGKGLSLKTISDTLSVLRMILKYAQKKNLHPGCDGKGIKIKHETKRVQVFSKQEQQQLMTYLINHRSLKNTGILLCLFTGLRVGELSALKWEDISLSEKTVYVHETMQRIQTPGSNGAKTKILTSTPKSVCSIRSIPIPDEMLKILKSFSECHTGYFLTGEQNKFLEPRVMQKHFAKVLKECNIVHKNFHVLRHTFATRCIEFGFDVKTLSEILGHANTAITMNRYVHPSMELKRENMQRLSSLFAVN